MSVKAPTVPTSMIEQYAQELVRKARGTRVLALRATPRYDGPPEIDASGHNVLVRACVSSLAVREALLEAGRDRYLIVLTDRPDGDLGDSVTSLFWHQSVQPVDQWRTIPGLFGADRLAPELRRPENQWLADALLAHVPAGRYPAAGSGVVSLDHAAGSLAQIVLGRPRDQLGVGALIQWSTDPAARVRWQATPAPIREGVIRWMSGSVAPDSALVLQIAAAPNGVDALSAGLVADVLWPDGAAASAQPEVVAARTRLEPYLGGRTPDPQVAASLARAARAVAWRMSGQGTPDLALACQRAEVLLDDIGWSAGAERSLVLPRGFEARITVFAAAVEDGQAAAERALDDLERHDWATGAGADEVRAARMACRLLRWLPDAGRGAPTRLTDAIDRQVRVDGWVDWALGVLWAGSSHPGAAAAYQRLCQQVIAARRVHDEQFAALLAQATGQAQLPVGVVGVEDALAARVLPLAAASPVLMLVVDGMSAAVACELVADAGRLGWVEVAPASSPDRGALLAALPTLTTHSRTSLLTGVLGSGTQVEEKRAFPLLAGGPLFHKNDLRAPAGSALAPAVAAAISGPDRVVGVVLNTVDDALAKADPDSMAWTIGSVAHLKALLGAAAAAGRAVVVTSDHGHVVERGGAAQPVPGAENRWRPASTGPAGPHEVLLAGPRVLAGGGRIVAPWVEDHRYAAKSAGYHGGASPAEACIPFVVLARDGQTAPAGFEVAGPQAPPWWERGAEPPAAAPPAGRPKRRAPEVSEEQGSLFTLAAPADPVADLVDRVLASDTYARQRARARRTAIRDDVVRVVLGLLIAGGGRAGRREIAAAAGFAENRFDQHFAALARMLNVDRYPIIAPDPDGFTALLDVDLLRRQFLGANA